MKHPHSRLYFAASQAARVNKPEGDGARIAELAAAILEARERPLGKRYAALCTAGADFCKAYREGGDMPAANAALKAAVDRACMSDKQSEAA